MTKTKLLLVEDDDTLLESMSNYFQTEYDLICARSLAQARLLLCDGMPDVCVLDLILPDGNGLDLLTNRELTCPTVILTSLADDDDHEDGLNAGAKDYLIKPVSMRILARHISLRLAPTSKAILSYGKLTINTVKRMVNYNGSTIPLTSSEFNILLYLFENADCFHTAEEIYTAVYGDAFLQSTTIKMHLSNLRYKLAQAAPQEQYIQTAYGKGYRFIKDPTV
ncbi:MAG: response regulator transcription factor [Candidatus Coproplasma sp.]